MTCLRVLDSGNGHRHLKRVRYHALACDYDGTLAEHGEVDDATLDALQRLLDSGRRLILVTGRELEDLFRVFPAVTMFQRIVAENGGVLYVPERCETRPLGSKPPGALVAELERRGVQPLSVGRTVVATWEPHQNTVLDVIRELGLEHQVIFNKGAVMVLPPGVNKRTGLSAALEELGLSWHNCVGVGDAENDHAFLCACECAVAVGNALPAVKDAVDIVTQESRGAGVRELIEHLLEDDLQRFESSLTRHHVSIGTTQAGEPVTLPPYGCTVLVAGVSGAGKSTAATAVIEQLAEREYQVCVVDPEGDYEGLQRAVTSGSPDHPPKIEHVLEALGRPDHAVINLLGVGLEDRPELFFTLLGRLQNLFDTTGRPHWLVVDEAHHMLGDPRKAEVGNLPDRVGALLLITVHPARLDRSLLERVDVLIGVGKEAASALEEFAHATSLPTPAIPTTPERADELLLWRRGEALAHRVAIATARTIRRRHRRKYAHGELGTDKSFYFRGPHGRLKLRAQNLAIFTQMADGVDDDTWQFHLDQGDVSGWFRDAIKDEALADETARIEQSGLSAIDSRAAIREAIERRYTGDV